MRQLLKRFVAIILVTGLFSPSLSAYQLIYKEQLYRLHHEQLYMDPLDIAENIHWLEEALRADFANPLNALATIHNPQEWETYRNLFTMHLNLKLVEIYLQWGSKYNKFEAYFFNAPFKRQNLESLDIAEKLFKYALVYWSQAKDWSIKAGANKWINLPEIQFWHDEQSRIQDGSLDYAAIIAKHLQRLATVRAKFKAMDDKTY